MLPSDPPRDVAAPEGRRLKNPDAATREGAKGGKRGGKARAAKLSPEQRVATAKRAAAARWRKGTD